MRSRKGETLGPNGKGETAQFAKERGPLPFSRSARDWARCRVPAHSGLHTGSGPNMALVLFDYYRAALPSSCQRMNRMAKSRRLRRRVCWAKAEAPRALTGWKRRDVIHPVTASALSHKGGVCERKKEMKEGSLVLSVALFLAC